MVRKIRPLRRRDAPVAARACALAAGAVLAAGAIPAVPALAQSRGNAQAEHSQALRERMFGRNLPSTGRYVSETGQAFVLDRSGSRTLLRFERSTEIWVLRPTPAPRGDIIYRNDNGDQILRVTPDGGMTLYTTATPRGAPVSLAGAAETLAPPTLGPVQLWNYIVRQSGRASQALGRLVVVDVDIRPGSEVVAADALSTATDAILRMSRSNNLDRQAALIRRIVVTDEGRPGVSFSRGSLRIGIDPEAGVAGRPSSARIVRVMAEAER